jgi:glycosyltransferase involved in cell wall biosynthesis
VAVDRVSFIVPTRNSERTIGPCLASLAQQRDADVEILLIDNRSTDSTIRIARDWAHHVETWGPERCAQRNRGAQIATGDVVAFVDSDMVLECDVARESLEAFAADPALGALVIPERAFGSGPWIGARRLEKESYLDNANVEAARVFRSTAFESVGGYDESMVAGEDWDLADRVEASGQGVGRVQATVWHDEGHISLREAFHKKRYYGTTWAQSASKHGYGTRSVGAARVPSLIQQVLRSPRHGCGLAVLKVVEAAGFAIGSRDARRVL